MNHSQGHEQLTDTDTDTDTGAVPIPASTQVPGVDLQRLMAWMDAQGLEQGPLSQLQTLSGGTQNILLRFVRGERAFVLRRPPLHLRSNSNDTMRREARVLQALRNSDVPHPRLIAACADELVLGAAFYLMEPITGFNATTGLPPLHAADASVRRAMGFAMVDAILALGRVDHVVQGLADFGKSDGFLDRQVNRWQKQLDSYQDMAGWPGPESIPAVKEVAHWLTDHQPTAFTPGIMHGDFQIANVMFAPDSARLAAVVDWELATIGDPLLDLGWLVATWPMAGQAPLGTLHITPTEGFAKPQELIDAYRLASYRDVSAIHWYVVLACYKLGILLEGTYARALAGQASMATGEALHQMTLNLFDRAQWWMASDSTNH